MSIVGIIPARMAAFRFPGKPLHPIAGKPMLQHVYERAKQFETLDHLVVATPDEKIRGWCSQMDIPVVLTSGVTNRALDRVAKAAEMIGLNDDDIVMCIQGDEPLITPDLLRTTLEPLEWPHVDCTVLALPIVTEGLWRNPDTVKIVRSTHGAVLYTSRAPIPYMEKYVPGVALRVGGMFAFRKWMLDWFVKAPETPLEVLESCDSNRICGSGRKQHCAIAAVRPYFSVDRIQDVALVEEALELGI